MSFDLNFALVTDSIEARDLQNLNLFPVRHGPVAGRSAAGKPIPHRADVHLDAVHPADVHGLRVGG
jgi:hypothetical protein